MNIDTGILLDRVEQIILDGYSRPDVGRVLSLLRTTVLAGPAQNCRIRGSHKDWVGLPPEKSLFHSAPGCGLPIGNLTSQVLANAYLSPLDHFIKDDLKIAYYGRYVDDLVLVHRDDAVLRHARQQIGEFLRTQLSLTLHPRKVVLQSHAQGVRYLGVVVKPGRTYLGARAKGRCHENLATRTRSSSRPPSEAEAAAVVATLNSYLGLMRQFTTYRLRRRVVLRLDERWRPLVTVVSGYRSVRKRGCGA
jgi:hypothetical protein